MAGKPSVASGLARVVVILGPTASGKSELAVHLAEECGGEIINADSMQIYNGLDIGTAKPSAELRQRVPHHLLDLIAPDQSFTAADFRREATAIIADIQRRGRRAFVVGGTGLYLRTLLHGLVDSPGSDEAVRAELTALAERKGNAELLRRLAAVDPETAGRLHANDRFRIIRALEVYQQSGQPISLLRQRHGFAELGFSPLKIGIRLPREELYRRINVRVEKMFAAGLVDEVRGLLDFGYAPTCKALRAIGYKESCAFLAGTYPLEEAIRLVQRNTRHYAKRQLTWFNRETDIIWLENQNSFATIKNNVIEFFV